jgi:hypothetical protein
MRQTFTLALIALVLVARPAAAQDAIDVSAAVINGGADVRSWAVTTTITALSTSAQGLEPLFAKRQGLDWPDVIPAGWTGPVYYTVWLGARLQDGVHLAASLNVYRGQLGSGAGDVTNIGQYSQNLWYLDGGLKGHVVTEGETLYLMVTAGGLRGASAISVQERSNVVAFQASSQPRTFMFSAPPPVVTPPPPVIVPPPPPVVTPPPVVPPAPVLDLSGVSAQLAALASKLEAVDQNVTDSRAENRTFFESVKSIWAQIGAPLVKYVLPAVAAFVAGKKL